FRAATPLETLAQVKGREPAPPSRLDPAVPRDLETICLKCLAKDPARRYATARDLADDLGRFRRGEPIRARPVGPLGRARRWARRNPALAALLVALAAVVAGSGAGLAFLWRRAEDSAAAARASAARADGDRAQAERSGEEAGALLAEFIRAGQDPAPDGFAAHLDRQLDLLRRAEAHCRDRLARRPDDVSARAALADVYAGMARLHAQCERSSEAEACLRQAEEILVALPPGTASAEQLGRLVEGYDKLSALCYRQGRAAPGLEAGRRAAVLAERVAREQPGAAARLALAESRLKLAGLMSSSQVSTAELTRYAQAVRDWRELVGTGEPPPATRRRLVEVYLCLGDLYDGARQLTEALRCWQTAADESAKLLDEDGPRLATKRLRATACSRLAEHAGSAPYYSEAVRLLEEIGDEQRARAERDPTNIVWQQDLTDTLHLLGTCHLRAGAASRAAQQFAQCAREGDRLVGLLAGPGHEADLIDELCQVAAAYLDAGDPAAALERARRAAAALDRLTAPPGDDPVRRELRAGRSHRLAHALRRAGAPAAEALARADESRALFEGLRRASPERLDLGYGLYLAWDEVAKAHIAADREEEAARAWASAVAVLRDLIRQAPDVELYRHEMAQRCLRLGRYRRGQGQLAEAEAWFLEVEALWPGDEATLRDVARELDGLAAATRDEAERRRYRDVSERVSRAARAARRAP
ncbi:MAG TPA: hypothetical protein VFA26_22330, partial [Gemmataceae bacterium]|nr:hypothetical protein [Gemmataceae bacterium]